MLSPADRRRIAAERMAAMRLDPPAHRQTAAKRVGEPVSKPVGQPVTEPVTEPVGELVERTVAHHLAMQAQDLASGMWSVGVRTGASLADIEEAIADRRITRSWPMRGTLHLMATRDIRWMCRLLNPALHSAQRLLFQRSGLTDDVVATARHALVSALAGGHALSRPECFAVLSAAGVDTSTQRGYHLLGRFCQDGLMCQGPAAGHQPSFVLLEEWVPQSWDPGREEAMAALATRYVAGHGPATVRDLAGWCGQGLTFAREAVALAGDAVTTEEIGGISFLVSAHRHAPATRPGVRLLPGFDEYVLGYKDRSAVLTAQEELRVVPGKNGMFLSTVVVGGQVAGLWRRTSTSRRVAVEVTPFQTLGARRRRELERAADAYGRFVGRAVEVTYAG